MNKAQTKRKCQEILNFYQHNCIVNESEHYKFLIKLFSRHPEWEQKMGVGVEYIYVANTHYGNKCFHIKRYDTTTTDISYITCIKGSVNKLDNIKAACRHAIKHIIKKERDKVMATGVECPITGDHLWLAKSFHIDHYDLTFAELFSKWIEGKDIEVIYLATNHKPEDGSTETKFTDQLIKQDFIDFHNANTHLRAVSVYANTVILRK